MDTTVEIVEREMENLFNEDADNNAVHHGHRLHGAQEVQQRLQTYLGRQRVHFN
jgi:hypothetical protein